MLIPRHVYPSPRQVATSIRRLRLDCLDGRDIQMAVYS
jgi:hypothetical protein